MIPVSLKLSNFTSYGEGVPELNFTKFHLAAISGPNGAGKSSLLDAITWALWGTSRAGDSSDDLVHLGAKEMFVEFTFELDEHQYVVKRERILKHGGTTNLEFWSGDHNLTEGTIKATQQKIIDTLHLTFETFTNSSFLRQGHADEFTTKGPTDRKRILADILGLSHYDLLEEKAKEKVKDVQNKLKLLEYQTLEIETELSQKEEGEKRLEQAKQQVTTTEAQIKSLESELKILQKQKETYVLANEQRNKLEQNLLQQQQEMAEIIKQGKIRAERIKDYELRISSYGKLDHQITELKKTEKELESLRKKQWEKLELQKLLASLQGELNLKNHQKLELEKEIGEVKNGIKKLSIPGAKCPTCGQEIGKDQKHKVNAELRIKNLELSKKLQEIKTDQEEAEIKRMEKALSLLLVDSQKLSILENSLKELESLQRQKETFLQDQASLLTEKKTREELLSLFKNKKAQVDKLTADLKSLPKKTGDLSKVENQIMEKEALLNSLRDEEKGARSLLGQAQELITRAKQLEKLLEQKRKEKTQREKEKQIFEELQTAFGKKGIQAMIIEGVIPEIEDETNKLLGKLTDGRMQVTFQTQREGKTTDLVIETLDIIISDEMGERSYELYSGGEAFRVNFAIRLALSKLLTRRAGARLQFLVIDEGFGTQDVQGRSRIVEVLDTIKNDFEKILIITHLEELKEEFPVRIEVSKNTLGSTFEVAGI